MLTFVMYGGAGCYQKVVYSCYNTSGTTWNVVKVIDEGTGHLDVEASGNAATITFTFKTTSGTQAYTPTVLVEHAGYSLETAYIS
jgi:hypothetical protein